MRKIITICAVLCLLISACNFKKAPKCDEESVKNTAIKLMKERINEQLKKGVYNNPSDIDGIIKSISSETKNIVVAKFPESVKDYGAICAGYHFSYLWIDEFKKYKEQTEDSLVAALNIDIKSIRIVNTNNEIRKCDCEADVYIEDSITNNVAYSAQYTEDETIYVTLSFE